ncbi:MAG: PRC-barrel domain-containing protein [Planctomycetes bacterium]|nr:PRC-barrel domain-containing protein [Planctomycetota bacterium]
MTLHRQAASIAATLLTLAGSATAQDGVPPATNQEKPSISAPAKTALRGRVCRVSKLLDCDVKDTKGGKIGEVEALVIDEDEGYIAYAVLSFGGFLGFDEKLFAIPFANVVRTDDDHCVVADLTKATLEKAPAFASDQWPTFDRTYGEAVHSYYKTTPYWNAVGGIPHQDATRITKDALDKSHLRTRGMRRASKVIGSSVVDTDGKSLGDVQEIVVDDGTGRVVYAVLSFGGFLGMGDKYFALPWTSLKRSMKDDDRMVLDVTKERLKTAPGFDQKNWPDMADARWGSEIHTFYGQDPYWITPKSKTELPREGR